MEKVKELISLYDRVLHGEGNLLGVLACAGYYNGC